MADISETNIPAHPTPQALVALLQWHLDMGADEAICDEPQDRFALTRIALENLRSPRATAPSAKAPAPPQPQPRTPVAAKAEAAPAAQMAEALASRATTLDELRAAMDDFEGCSLRRTATNLVFADGHPDAPVMFIGEAPGSDEDRIGKPFVGQSGQLLDQMLATIGLNRTENAYITNTVPWRPPGNRKPTPVETSLCLPFLRRHIALKRPKLLVFLGATPAGLMLESTEGITRLRGRWREWTHDDQVFPVLPMFHPAYLLRQPESKALAWRDMLLLKQKLMELSG